MKKLKIIFLLIIVSATGCASFNGKEPFQIYTPKHDCVACKKQELWGFSRHSIYRKSELIYFASFRPLRGYDSKIEETGLCLGTALDTLKSGATHFRVLDKEEWGDWYYARTPAKINIDGIVSRPGRLLYGSGTIVEGGIERLNRDQSMWYKNHYYKIGSPECDRSKDNFDLCSTRHEFNIQDCSYKGEELRKKTEEQRGSLACVMKRNPRLLLENAYRLEALCGYYAEGWISAAEVVKKYGTLFEIKE